MPATVYEGDVAEPDNEQLRVAAQQVINTAVQNKLTLGTAESCTGGLVAGSLTAVPGSSAAFLGGVVSYSPLVKHHLLNVDASIIDDPRVGVVSGPCAAEMAEGACRALNCDLAVSITGIAGPGGAEPGKPVGTVWFGVHSPSGTHTQLHHFTGNRDTVRTKSVLTALRMLQQTLG
ncbi:MAG: CinA family protein [Atopobiaceae bacterium]|jgi:nicotinamide-nucleotide amidase